MKTILTFLFLASLAPCAFAQAVVDLTSATLGASNMTVGSMSAKGFLADSMRAGVKRLAYARTNASTQQQWLTGSGGVNTNCWLNQVNLTWLPVLDVSNTGDLALVSSNVLVGASHISNTNGVLVVFRTASGVLHTNSVAAINNGVSDMKVFTLSSNVISGITPMLVFSPDVTNYLSRTVTTNTASFTEIPSVALVKGNDGKGYVQRLQSTGTYTKFDSQGGSIFYQDIPVFSGGDSGSPFFAVVGTNCILMGMLYLTDGSCAPLFTGTNWSILTNTTAGNHRTFDLSGYAQRQ